MIKQVSSKLIKQTTSIWKNSVLINLAIINLFVSFYNLIFLTGVNSTLNINSKVISSTLVKKG